MCVSVVSRFSAWMNYIVVPGQNSEEVMDAGICNPHLQYDVLS